MCDSDGASTIASSIDSLGPIELGPATLVAIILSGYAANGAHVSAETVTYAKELVRQIGRGR